MFVNSGSFITLTHSYENHYFGIQVPVPVRGVTNPAVGFLYLINNNTIQSLYFNIKIV